MPYQTDASEPDPNTAAIEIFSGTSICSVFVYLLTLKICPFMSQIIHVFYPEVTELM